MIELLIFYLLIVASIFAYVKQWQKSGVKEASMMFLVIGLAFAIIWAMSSPIANLIMPKSLETPWFKTDTLSLIILMIPMSAFYYIYVLKEN